MTDPSTRTCLAMGLTWDHPGKTTEEPLYDLAGNDGLAVIKCLPWLRARQAPDTELTIGISTDSVFVSGWFLGGYQFEIATTIAEALCKLVCRVAESEANHE